MSLSEHQLWSISVTERVCSAVSLFGTALIIGTFLLDKSFRKPINRLVFYASWGNIMSNVGTMISRSGIMTGVDSGLCQFQGFLIQMFLPADAMWMLCLAFNVYLTFFRKYDAERLRALEWKYLCLCYGTTFVPGFVYFFVKTSSRGKIYGSATLWCWVSLEWDYLRIAVFYGPVWLVILATFTIYIYTGIEIFRKRRELRAFSHTPEVLNNPLMAPFTMSKMTEVEVRSELAYSPTSENDAAPYGHFINIESAAAYPTRGQSTKRQLHAQHTVASEANAAAWSYCLCSMLFFVALLITWVPSTANRVFSLIHPSEVNFGLNYVSAMVLPLQGFWNTLVYITISRPAAKALFYRLIRKSPKSSCRQWPSSGPKPLDDRISVREKEHDKSDILELGPPVPRVSMNHRAQRSRSAPRENKVEEMELTSRTGSGSTSLYLTDGALEGVSEVTSEGVGRRGSDVESIAGESTRVLVR